MNQTYEIDFSGGLKPIVVAGFELGDPVRQAHTGGLYWVIGETHLGYTIANEKGEQRTDQRAGTLSPYTRISRDSYGAKRIDAAGIERLKEAVIAKREADQIAKAKADEEWRREYDAELVRLRSEFPWLTERKNERRYAWAAKNLRKHLKLAFPGVKFTVRCSSFSGGDSIDVGWTLGPTRAEVAAIADRYEYGSFNGMDDSYTHDERATAKAFFALFGCSKYVHCSREIPQELRDQVEKDYRAQVTGFAEHHMSTLVYQALEPVSFHGREYAGLVNERGRMIADTRPIQQ